MSGGRVLAAVLCGCVAAAPLMASAAPGSFDAIPDVSWTGGMVFKTGATFGEFETTSSMYTSFNTEIAAGQVTGGVVDFVANGQSADGDGSYAILAFDGVGGMSGPATRPVMTLDVLQVSGTAGALGIDLDVDFALAGDELAPLPLDIYAVTCEKATGSIVQTVGQNGASGGGTGFAFSGSWNMFREAGAPPDVVQGFSDLLSRATQMLEAAEAGIATSPSAVLKLVDDAEAFEAALVVNEACRLALGGTDPGHVLGISPVIRDLIELVIANPGGWSLSELNALVQAGIRSGVFGPDHGADSETLSIGLEAILGQRLELAEAAGDIGDVQQVLLIAIAMGWDGLAADAMEALS